MNNENEDFREEMGEIGLKWTSVRILSEMQFSYPVQSFVATL